MQAQTVVKIAEVTVGLAISLAANHVINKYVIHPNLEKTVKTIFDPIKEKYVK